MREPTTQSPRLVRKRLGRPVGAVISFRPVGRWQAKSLHSSKITSGEKARMQFVKITLEQRVMERLTLEQVVDTETGRDSEGDLCWGGS